MSMALAAIGIDAMLPAFGAIRSELGLAEDSTAVTGLVTFYFFGLALGTLAYGPLSDRFGRRPALFAGFAVYAIGAAAATLASTLPLLLAARLVWGLGAASSRVVTLAVIRDRYSGEQMARTMSFVMAIFILVPVIGPALGTVVVAVGGWRWVFGGCLILAVLMALWATRLPETLSEDRRRPLRPRRQVEALREVLASRQTIVYGIGMTVLYGAFTSYIGSSEVIVTQVFDKAAYFPVIFGGLAATMGLAMAVSGKVVERVGTRRLSHIVLVGYVAVAAILVGAALVAGGHPPLWLWLTTMGAMLAAHALLIPNLNTLAMDPMGNVAGTASSLIGGVQLGGGATLGALIDQSFNGTVVPLALGFLAGGITTLALIAWAEGGQLALRPPEPKPVVLT